MQAPCGDNSMFMPLLLVLLQFDGETAEGVFLLIILKKRAERKMNDNLFELGFGGQNESPLDVGPGSHVTYVALRLFQPFNKGVFQCH